MLLSIQFLTASVPSPLLYPNIHVCTQQNVMSQEVTLSISVSEVFGLDLSRGTGYIEVYRGFPMSLQTNTWIVP